METTVNKQLTFAQHVAELRRRLGLVAVCLIVFGAVGYASRSALIVALQKPLKLPLYYTSPGGGFNFIMQVVLLVGLFFSIPIIVYQLIRFIEPALDKVIKKATVLKVVAMSFTLATLGILFAYFMILPLSLRFFVGYSSDILKPLITADQYMSFILSVLITFVLIFQIPLIILFINHIKPLKPSTLLKHQKLIVVGALGLAIVLPFTYSPIEQFILAAPIILLYYTSILLVYATNKLRRVPGQAAVIEPQLAQVVYEPHPEVKEQQVSIPKRRPLLVDGITTTKHYEPRVTLVVPRSIEMPKIPRKIAVA